MKPTMSSTAAGSRITVHFPAGISAGRAESIAFFAAISARPSGSRLATSGELAFCHPEESLASYYEVVLRQTFSTPYSGKASELFESVQRASPSPYQFLLQFGEEQLVGASPEMFMRVDPPTTGAAWCAATPARKIHRRSARNFRRRGSRGNSATAKLLKYICREGFEHHVAANFSDVSKAVHESARYLGWESHYHPALED